MRFLFLLLFSMNVMAHTPMITTVGDGREIIIHDGTVGELGSAAAAAVIVDIGGPLSQPCDRAGMTTCADADPNTTYTATTTNWTALSHTYEFYVVYPFGTKNTPTTQKTNGWSWNAGICCGQAQESNDDSPDVAQIVAILAAYPNDKQAISGYSNGAEMALRVVCEANIPTLRWVGVVGGTLSVPYCNNSRGVNIFHIHGDADPVELYEGGIGAVAADTHIGVDENARLINESRFYCDKSDCHENNWRCLSDVYDGDWYDYYIHFRRVGGTHNWGIGTAEQMWQKFGF